MALLPFRLHSGPGQIAVRDGIVFVLFLDALHVDVADAVGRVYDRYLAAIDPTSLEWVWASGDSYKPATPRRRHQFRRRLTAAAAAQWPDERLSIKGGCQRYEPGAHLFEYWGAAAGVVDGAEAPPKPPASTIEIWFPSELPERLGRAAFVTFLLGLAAEVPFASGYCSLAFNLDNWAQGPAALHITGPAFRHPGMDVHCTWSTALYIETKVRGAYWLTLVGPTALATLAKPVDELRATLGPEVTVHELSAGIAIEAGDELRPGDMNRGDDLPLTRRVAALLQPVTLLQDLGAFGFAGDPVQSFIDWQQRHLREP
jgi:hypothetical protein